jgi:hypothetical protein
MSGRALLGFSAIESGIGRVESMTIQLNVCLYDRNLA